MELILSAATHWFRDAGGLYKKINKIKYLHSNRAAERRAGNKVRVLGVVGDKRAAELPNVPTMAEAGYPKVDVVAGYFILVPAKTPKPVIAVLNREIVKAMADKDVRERLAAAGVEPTSSTPEESMVIKAVFFDFDGVLTTDKTGSLTTNRYLSERMGIRYELIRDAFRQYNNDLTLGRTTHAEVWPAVCKALGCDINRDLLRDAFDSTPMNDDMLLLAGALKANYSVGIITDNKKDRIDHLRKYQELESMFNPIVVSSEVGSSKETPAIFVRALSLLGLLPGESIFIDNNQDNLIAPKALGMNVIYFDDEKNDVEGLKATMRNKFGFSIHM